MLCIVRTTQGNLWHSKGKHCITFVTRQTIRCTDVFKQSTVTHVPSARMSSATVHDPLFPQEQRVVACGCMCTIVTRVPCLAWGQPRTRVVVVSLVFQTK